MPLWMAVPAAGAALAAVAGCAETGRSSGPELTGEPVAMATIEGPAARDALVDGRRGAAIPLGAADSVYELRPGDVINVIVWNRPELSLELTVAPDGRIQYPLVGEVQAAGRTLPGLERVMTERLVEHLFAPQVSVSLQQLRSFRIYVTGEVLRPGMFELNGPVTVVQAIAMAGGFTAFASPRQVLIYNPQQPDAARRAFDFTRFLDEPDMPDIVMTPGDTVIVR